MHALLLVTLATFAASAPTQNGPAPLTPIVESVADRQVFQRDAQGGAFVRVEGSCLDGLAALGARVALGAERIAWKELALRDQEGPRQRFDGQVRVPAGGWYRLELASSADGAALFTVQRFGVGEVFVIAGQSNSANYGEERTPSYDDRVSAFDGSAWTLAQDPMPGVQDKSQGGSPWPQFGALVARALDVPVAIASTGFGGTSIRAWQKNHEYVTRDERKFVLFQGLADRLGQLGAARAILWHQGETDAMGAMPSAEYVAHFEKLKADLAAELDFALPPILVAHASYVPELAAPKMQAIRDAQTQLWTSGAALRGPDTDELLGAMRHSKDHIHFSRRGLEAHATRWFAMAYAQLFTAPIPR